MTSPSPKLTRTDTLIALLTTLRQAQMQPSSNDQHVSHSAASSRTLHFDDMYHTGSYDPIVKFLAQMWNRRHQLPAIPYTVGKPPKTHKMTASQAYWQLHAYYIDAELHRINVPKIAYLKHRPPRIFLDLDGLPVTRPVIEVRRHPQAVEHKARAAAEWVAGELRGPLWLPKDRDEKVAA